MNRAAAAVVLVVVGCTAARPPTPTRAPTPTPLPINVDNMMGLVPQQTVFVATQDHISAVTLLNHFIRYTIATDGLAQLGADPAGQSLYVLDAGGRRLRLFDPADGALRAVREGIADVVSSRRALVVKPDGRALLLKGDQHHVWVESFDPRSLQPLGSVMDGPSCGDRLLAGSRRAAVVCSESGSVLVDDLHGNRALVDAAVWNLAAVAMADSGALYMISADHQLAMVPAASSTLVKRSTPDEWSGTVLPAGLAVTADGMFLTIAEQAGDGVWLRVLATGNGPTRQSIKLDGPPSGGLLVLWPFVYYAVGSTIRHADLTTGLLETMAEVGPGAVAGAVISR